MFILFCKLLDVSTCLRKARLEPAALTLRLFALDEMRTVFFGKELERLAVNLDRTHTHTLTCMVFQVCAIIFLIDSIRKQIRCASFYHRGIKMMIKRSDGFLLQLILCKLPFEHTNMHTHVDIIITWMHATPSVRKKGRRE